jgi:hypothetical protein
MQKNTVSQAVWPDKQCHKAPPENQRRLWAAPYQLQYSSLQL